MITYIDYVHDESGDWAGLYFNFQMKYQGHSISEYVWLNTLEMATGTQIEVRSWSTTMDHVAYTSYPVEFMDLMRFSEQYQVVGEDGADACALHEFGEQ